MSAKGDAAGNDIYDREVKPIRAVRWRGHGSLGLECASTLVRNGHGDTVENMVTVVARISVSGLLEDGNDWKLGDFLLSMNVVVRVSLYLDFTAIQT